MPPSTKEILHYHDKAQQFFYIISGNATFEIDGLFYDVGKNKGICIKPGIKHRILNNSNIDLEFIVVSEPKSYGDRVNLDVSK